MPGALVMSADPPIPAAPALPHRRPLRMFAAAPTPSPAGLPGPISGIGGGTWNLDGSSATPDQDGRTRQLPGSQPNHWTVEGFDQQRQAEAPPAAGPPAGPLGGSMREPFDYDRAFKALAGDQRHPKWWQYGLAVLGDAVATNQGGTPFAMNMLFNRQQAQRARMQDAVKTLYGWQHQDWARQNEADLSASAPFTIGRDRLAYDPASGQVTNLYHGPQDFELYAQQLGAEPGSPEYFKAVEDYVLRSSGPSALERDTELDDHRTANDASLERLRYGNRVGLEDHRQVNRQEMVDYRNAHPAPPRRYSGSPRQNIVSVKTPAEAMRLPPGTHYRGPDGVVRER